MALTVQGDVGNATLVGLGGGKTQVTNVPTWTNFYNIAQTVIDLQNSGMDTARVYTTIPATGATIVLPTGYDTYYINNSAVISALTITFPATTTNGQKVTLAFNGGVTSLTLNAQGSATIAGTITTAAANSKTSWQYINGTFVPA